jgi:hypothetical protein
MLTTSLSSLRRCRPSLDATEASCSLDGLTWWDRARVSGASNLRALKRRLLGADIPTLDAPLHDGARLFVEDPFGSALPLAARWVQRCKQQHHRERTAFQVIKQLKAFVGFVGAERTRGQPVFRLGRAQHRNYPCVDSQTQALK